MKHLILILALVGTTLTFAQDGGKKGQKREMIKQQKIAFITTEVGFTDKEAEKFWPKYNKMEEDTKEHHQKMRELKKKMKDMDSMSDKDIKKAIEDHMELEAEGQKYKHDFIKDIMTILPPKKVAKYIAAEMKFKKQLLKKLQEHKKGGPNGKGGPNPGNGPQ